MKNSTNCENMGNGSNIKQVKPSSFTEDQPPGWDEKASKSHLGKHQSYL